VVDAILREAHGQFPVLLRNRYANYNLQKVVERSTPAHLHTIIRELHESMGDLCLDDLGSRFLQRFVEQAHTDSACMASIARELADDAVRLLCNKNSNFVIKKILMYFAPEHKEFVYAAVNEHLMQIALSKYGCCAVQRCLDYASVAQRTPLFVRLASLALTLVEDTHASYIVLHLLSRRWQLAPGVDSAALQLGVVQLLCQHVDTLCMRKVPANLLERILELPQLPPRARIVTALAASPALVNIACNPFGAFVVLAALRSAAPEQLALLSSLLCPALPRILTAPYGSRIAAQLATIPAAPPPVPSPTGALLPSPLPPPAHSAAAPPSAVGSPAAAAAGSFDALFSGHPPPSPAHISLRK
jgi:hypothetical protein